MKNEEINEMNKIPLLNGSVAYSHSLKMMKWKNKDGSTWSADYKIHNRG